MTDPDYQAFLAWKASQEEAAKAATHDEVPVPTIAEVLKTLVRSARLPEERTVDTFCAVIDDHFADKPSGDSADSSAPAEMSTAGTSPAPGGAIPGTAAITFAPPTGLAGETGGGA